MSKLPLFFLTVVTAVQTGHLCIEPNSSCLIDCSIDFICYFVPAFALTSRADMRHPDTKR